VTATVVSTGERELLRITVRNGDSTGLATIVATDNHPFWVPSAGGWVRAVDLRPGQWLQASAGTWIQIASVEHGQRMRVTTFNLTVAVTHTYFIHAGSAPVLVHNQCPDPSDELLNLADVNIGRTNVAAQVVAPNGARGWGISANRGLQQLTPQVRAAVQATGHRMTCAEIGALCFLEFLGTPIRGARGLAVKVTGGSKGYTYEQHGEVYPFCRDCEKLFDYIEGGPL
jgi:hypothetical protein